jgi:signal transduction histidine kinase
MAEHRAVCEHRLFTRLTAIKLAGQLLDRDRGLSDRHRRLVRTVIREADDLVADLLERRQAEPEQAAPRDARPRAK